MPLQPAARALRVGLTGGIACGKSHVLRRLAAAGLRTIDLDRVAHGLMAPGAAAYDEVVAAFGPDIVGPGGVIDRRALGAVVFGDPEARARLNALVHPRVRAEEERWFAGAGGGEVAITDAALLVETGLHLRFDRLVVVRCRRALQFARLRQRDGLDETAAAARLAAQMDADDKARFAHFEIDSSGEPHDTDVSVDALAALLRELAVRPRSRGPLAETDVEAWLARLGPGAPPLPAAAGLFERARAAGCLGLPGLLPALRPPRAGAWPAAPGPDPALEPAIWPAAAAAGLLAALWHPGDLEWAAAAGYALGRLAFAGRPAQAGAALAAVAACDLASAGAAAGAEAWPRVAATFAGIAPHPSALAYAAQLASATGR